jgi:predicted transcriptional regulator
MHFLYGQKIFFFFNFLFNSNISSQTWRDIMNFKELRLKRRKLRMTQNDLAAEIGCSQSRISLFESGKLKPTFDEMALILIALKLDE